MFGHRQRANVYFALSLVGLITAWWLNGIASFEGQDYLGAWFGSEVDWVLSVDLTIVAIAVAIFMITEARQLGMKRVWLYFVLAGITALAFTFPLFMGFRELRKEKIALAGGRIDYFEVDKHKVEVWVPEKVFPHTPVLIIQDGKNIFNPKTASNGTTWEILDALSKGRIKADPLPIIVAVWGLSDETRLLELAPESIVEKHPEIWDELPPEYTPPHRNSLNGEHTRFLAEALLPTVLKRYGIEHSVNRTAISGCSMAGLSSLYAMSKYPNSFGAALCFSTHWVLGHRFMVEELVALLPQAGNHKIYTDCGTEDLDLFYPPFHEKAIRLLTETKGYRRDRDLVAAIFPGTGHNETAWAARVHHPINWWLRG